MFSLLFFMCGNIAGLKFTLMWQIWKCGIVFFTTPYKFQNILFCAKIKKLEYTHPYGSGSNKAIALTTELNDQLANQ